MTTENIPMYNDMPLTNWPYPTINRMWHSGDHSWYETGEGVFYEQLECLPPAAMKANVFMVGEPWSHGEHGPIHAVFCTTHNRFFCRYEYLSVWQPAIFNREIKEQFGL